MRTVTLALVCTCAAAYHPGLHQASRARRMTVTASTQPPEPPKRGLQHFAASIVVATTLQFGMPMDAQAAKPPPQSELQVLLRAGRPG